MDERLMWRATSIVGAVALIATWLVLGLQIITSDGPVSARSLVLALAGLVVGLGLAALLCLLPAPMRRRRQRPPGLSQTMMVMSFVLLGLTQIGWAIDPSDGWLSWVRPLFAVAGGFMLGTALVLALEAETSRN